MSSAKVAVSEHAASNVNAACPISSAVTFVINTQGPGPFTFNINLTGGTSPTDTINFSVNTSATAHPTSPASRRQQRPLPSRAKPLRAVSSRKFLITPHKSGYDSLQEVPETPEDMLPLPLHKKPRLSGSFESQEVNPPGSPQSMLVDASDTEDDSGSDYHANEPVAVFSPGCQLVSPSRKRKPQRMALGYTTAEQAREEEEEEQEEERRN